MIAADQVSKLRCAPAAFPFKQMIRIPLPLSLWDVLAQCAGTAWRDLPKNCQAAAAIGLVWAREMLVRRGRFPTVPAMLAQRSLDA